MKFYFGFKYWFACFIIVILLGLGFSSIISSIVAEIIRKEEKMEYKKVFLDLFKVNMPTGFGLGLVCCFLFTIKKEYQFNIELLVLGALFMSGLLSFIETKDFVNFLLGIGGSLIYPVMVWVVKEIIKLVKYLQEKYGKKKPDGEQSEENSVKNE